MQLIIIAVFAALIFAAVRSKIDRTPKFYILSFQLTWFAVLLISTFQPYDLDRPSDFAYFLLITNVVCFSAGFFIKRYRRISAEIFNNTIDSQVSSILSNRYFITMLFVACVFSLYYFSKVYVAMQVMGSLAELRSAYYDYDFFGPEYVAVNGLFLFPMQVLCYPLLAISIYKRKWVSIPILVFLFSVNSLSGGRFGYVKIFYAIIFFFVCIKTINFKKIVQLSFAAVGLFFLLSFITASRMGEGSTSTWTQIENGTDKTLEHITTYACGAVVAFDKSLKLDYVGQIGGHTYGAVTGSSVVQVAYIVLNKIGLGFEQPMDRFTKIKQDSPISVGKDHFFNALYTAVLFFYTDFGVLGVILIPLLLGYICRLFIHKLLIYRNFALIALITYCYIVTLFSITDFYFTTYSALFVVIILYKVGTRKKRLIRVQNLSV